MYLGAYYEENSYVHKCPAAVKFLLLIAMSIVVFSFKNKIVIGVFLGVVLFLILLSRVPFFRILRSMFPVLWLLILTGFIHVFTYHYGAIIFQWWIFTVTAEGLISAGVMSSQILTVVLGGMLFTSTTSVIEMCEGMEVLLYPLKAVGVRVRDIALSFAIAVSFIPIIQEEMNSLILAQRLKGAQYKKGNILKNLPLALSLLVPLFRRVQVRAEDLSFSIYNKGVLEDEKSITDYRV